MLTCAIISPEQNIVHENLQSMILPSVSGEMGLLPDHAESFILLQKGTVCLKFTSGETKSISLDKGVCHIKDNIAMIVI